MTSQLGPVSGKERIQSLDVMRGFALLGILAMNIGAFSMPQAAYFDPTAYGSLEGLNGWVWRIIHVLFDLKFMAIFAMLFGAGIVLAAQRAEATGKKGAAIHYRRIGWLIVFGLIHAYLFWYGDILTWYGLCGLVIFWFRKVSPRWLVVWGIVFISLTSLLLIAGGLSAPSWPPQEMADTVASMKPSESVIQAEIAAYQGTWLEQLRHRIPVSLEMHTETFLFWAFWRVSGLMFLGMALFKTGVFSAERSRRFYAGMVAAGVGVGIPMIMYGMNYNASINWEAPYYFFFGLQFNYWASILVAMGWIGAVMLVCKAGISRITRPLAAVGRTAFSNYILQTVLCTFLFYGHGFGLFGQIDRVGQAGIVLAIWILQLVVSPIWLRHFRFGPLEWLWRSLVYLQRQPFKRSNEVA